MHVVKDDDTPPGGKKIEQFIDKSIESRVLAVAGRWFQVLTPPVFLALLGWLLSTIISIDKDVSVINTRVSATETRLASAEGSLDSLRDFISQSRVAREKDLGELKQRISVLESQSTTLVKSASRQEDKLDRIFERLAPSTVR